MILFIDACARDNSRTRELAEYVLSCLSHDEVAIERANLYDIDLKPVDKYMIEKRDASLASGDFSDPYYDMARQFAAADDIVIASPYWDFSYPAVLKLYIENISVNGITFRYDENGIPHGLCHAQKLYYVTTAGGEIGKNNFGYDYIKAISLSLYGIRDATCIRAVGLDMVSVDERSVLENAKEQLSKMI